MTLTERKQQTTARQEEQKQQFLDQHTQFAEQIQALQQQDAQLQTAWYRDNAALNGELRLLDELIQEAGSDG